MLVLNNLAAGCGDISNYISHPEVDGKLVCLGHEMVEEGVGNKCRHVSNLEGK